MIGDRELCVFVCWIVVVLCIFGEIFTCLAKWGSNLLVKIDFSRKFYLKIIFGLSK